MIAAERQRRLVKLLKSRGSVSVRELSEAFGVTAMTVRRDLDKLERDGWLERTFGGAVSRDAFHIKLADDPPYEVKKKSRQHEKERIGAAAARLVQDGDTIIIDSGTTTLPLARRIRDRKELTVATNDLPIAVELAAVPTCSVTLIGGSVRTGIFSTWGSFAERMLREISARAFFMSADAVDVEHGVLNATAYEANIKHLMVEAAERVILLVDSTKFEKTALVRVCPWDRIEQVITDSGVPAPVVKALQSRGISVTVV